MVGEQVVQDVKEKREMIYFEEEPGTEKVVVILCFSSPEKCCMPGWMQKEWTDEKTGRRQIFSRAIVWLSDFLNAA